MPHVLLIIVTTIDAHLSPDFTRRKRRRMDVCIAFVGVKNLQESSEVPRRDVLGRHPQDVGGGPGPANRSAMSRAIRARRPAIAAAEEHHYVAVDLVLAKMNMGHLRCARQVVPRKS